ncbi:MAG: ATP-binding protein [Anaerolineae bacterium]
MNRLWVQLTLAFTLVVLVAVGVIAVLIGRTTDIEFRQYVTHSGMRASGSGIQQLVDYYQTEGSWDGVAELLASGIYVNPRLPGMGMPVISTERRGDMPGAPLDVLLADDGGRVVYDSTGQDVGRRLSRTEKSRAVPISAADDEEVLGYLLLALPSRPGGLGSLEQSFLDRMREVLLIGAALAVGLGLVMGLLVSRRLAAPLQRLSGAARAVAGGNLSQQVQVEGSAEIAEVGRAFNEMTTALGEAERLRQNMVADVAHELRTPLSVVQGNLRAILDDVYALDKTEISRLYDETRLLGRLVDDLRELALADAGQLRLTPRPFDLVAVIQSTLDTMAVAAEAQEVSLSGKLPGEALRAYADPDRVAQVLRNLLVNALRHTAAGGSVVVSAEALDGVPMILVRDTGEGIAAEDLAHVFDRFWRADSSRSRGDRWTGGSGLGLSVAQSLVEAQGGRIWVESTQGEGTVFRFTVPLYKPGMETPR